MIERRVIFPRGRCSGSWTWLWWSPCPGWWSPPFLPPSCRSPTWPWTPEICSWEGSCWLEMLFLRKLLHKNPGQGGVFVKVERDQLLQILPSSAKLDHFEVNSRFVLVNWILDCKTFNNEYFKKKANKHFVYLSTFIWNISIPVFSLYNNKKGTIIIIREGFKEKKSVLTRI